MPSWRKRLLKEVRTKRKNYCDRWVEALWHRYRPAVKAADDMESLVREGLKALQPTDKEVEEIAQGLRQKLREDARPADAPSRGSKDRMYK